MKVLVHLNHGIDKSYLLDFGNRINKADIKKVLRLGPADAARAIFGYANILESVQRTEIPESQKKKAGLLVDFIVGETSNKV